MRRNEGRAKIKGYLDFFLMYMSWIKKGFQFILKEIEMVYDKLISKRCIGENSEGVGF